ncbi:MAG TPA: hypothetical protein VGQ81_10885, partial [Acidobacteriota bacterium]|nr:hypothetical protein [Acidobacteriota bacterium]
MSRVGPSLLFVLVLWLQWVFSQAPSAVQPRDMFFAGVNTIRRLPVNDQSGFAQPLLGSAAELKPALADAYARLPLSFEENRGQADPRVKFISRGSSHALFLLPDEAVLRLRGSKSHAVQPAEKLWAMNLFANGLSQTPETDSVIRMRLVGAKTNAALSGMNPLAGKSNYVLGDSPNDWITDIPLYARVQYHRVYPGIDLVYYGNGRSLEYDFVVSPGASPDRIRLEFQVEESTGASGTGPRKAQHPSNDARRQLSLDQDGNIRIPTAAGVVRQIEPHIYQDINGHRCEVRGRYVLEGTNRVGFKVDRYDSTRPLVIDPQLVYSFSFGGSANDQGIAVSVDAAGNAYIGGNTVSKNFPTVGAFQS